MGRLIIDDVLLLVFENFYYMKNKSKVIGLYDVEVWYGNVYDCVEWSFLEKCML